jgi:hypothetical protein
MIEVYYYLPVSKLELCVDCGIKLSEWYDKQVLIDGENRNCISALLNPRDDMGKYHSQDLRCAKLRVSAKYCYVADKSLYEIGMGNTNIMKMYEESIIPVDKYIFGLYRNPECLITSTIIGGDIGILDKRIDSPVLFENSEKLYVDNLIERLANCSDNFNDMMLYGFFSKASETNRFDIIKDKEKKLIIFVDKINNDKYIVKEPDLNDYMNIWGNFE